MAFKWKDKDIRTHGDVCNALCALSSEQEAQEFMALARKDSPHADHNVGYLTGYFDDETATRVRRWTRATHPIFVMGTPTPEDAFRVGAMMGAKDKN